MVGLHYIKLLLRDKMIPRGLRNKKVATMIYSIVYQQEWDDILTSYSMDLIKIIVKYKKKALDELNINIQTAQQNRY